MAIKEYEVLVGGSGHSGGTAARMLTQKGISCLLLNGRPEADCANGRTAEAGYQLPFRAVGGMQSCPTILRRIKFARVTGLDLVLRKARVE